MQLIEWKDFEKIELRVGTIISVKINQSAIKKAYILNIDFGTKIGIKKTSAQVTDLYTEGSLLGKQVMAVINFPPKQIADMISEVLVTGFFDDKGQVVLLSPDIEVPNGSKLF